MQTLNIFDQHGVSIAELLEKLHGLFGWGFGSKAKHIHRASLTSSTQNINQHDKSHRRISLLLHAAAEERLMHLAQCFGSPLTY
jgi:hypothetical protein